MDLLIYYCHASHPRLREKEQSLFDTVPEEVIKPFFDPDKLPEEERTTSGISYKDIIKKRRQNQDSETQSSAAPTTSPPKADAVPLTATINELPSVVPQKAVSPQPVVQMAPPPPPVQTQTFQQAPTLIKSPETVLSLTEPSDPEGTKKKIRTFMGMLLKHRGGPGFGKGRLKGREIEQFDNLLEEVTGFLRVEAAQSSTTVYDAPPATREPSVPQPVMIQPAITVDPPTSVATPAQLDSMLACIEGAVLMYKNSPAELKSTVMVTLRAALAAAITTCDNAIGSDTNPIPTAASQVDGTIAVIEGAVSMYRNSPPELQSSVLITLRAALKIAVITCDSLLGTAPTVPSALSVPVVPAASVAVAQPVAATVPSQPVSPLSVPVVPATDRNSKALNEIYDKVKAASGEGRLGLRSDLSSEEASQLADGLMEMRGILMEELDAGIPDPEPAQGAQDSSGENSTISKYQQMLAKAKTEKTGNP